MKDYRDINFAKLTFGISECRGPVKKPYKWKHTIETSVVGSSIDEVLKLNPGFEQKYYEKFGLKKKATIKLINIKIIHSQGKTMYKI